MTGKGLPQPTVFWALFGLRGRIGRATFLLGLAFMLAILAVIVALIVNTPEEHERMALWGLAFLLAGLMACYSVFSLSLKRLHDIGLPSYAVVLLVVPPVSAFFALFLALKRGEPQTNAHGPAPFAKPTQFGKSD